MKPADVMREISYPLSDLAIMMSMLFFGLLFAVVRFSVTTLGMMGIALAIFLLATIVPPYFRYLLILLEARANGKDAPALDAELFGMANKLWSLTPLVLIALLIWGGIVISDHALMWVILYAATILISIPASLAILAITHSPLQSLNPVAIFRMILVCGPAYFLIPVLVVAMTFLPAGLGSVGIPSFFVDLVIIYQTILIFTLTGKLLHAKGVVFDLEFDEPLEATPAGVARDLEKERQKTVNHAYGIISRGNREGGFAHIKRWIQSESDIDAASAWFFKAMMKWENKDAALFFAQIYLAHLLYHDYDAQALKLISTCLHEESRWKPAAGDLQHVLDLAEKYHRDDLLKSLRN
jgi:hypothetical protein